MSIKLFFSITCLSIVLLGAESIFNVANGQCLYDFEKTKQGWVVETHHSTRGASSVVRSKLKSFNGESSLKVKLNLSKKSAQFSQGEIRVDLQAHSPGDKIGPLNLNKKIVTAYIYFPRSFEGESHSPNGIQLFAKSVERDSKGQEKWSSLYGHWINAAGQSGDWMKVRLLISNKKSDGIYVESGFNPESIRFIGVKFGLGGKASNNSNNSGTVQYTGIIKKLMYIQMVNTK